MSLKKIADRSGHTLTVMEYEGRLVPAFDIKSIAGVKDFKARPDDVIVCAYPKSGTHWVWEIVRVLMAGTVDVPMAEKDVGMIEDVLPENLEKQESPRPLNTHFHFELLPESIFTQKSKLIYVTRDPRDVAVSFFHHHKKLVKYYDYHGDFHDYFHLFINGQVDYESWFKYTKGWEQGIADKSGHPVFVTSYETLHEDTMNQVRKLSEFLGFSYDDNFLNEVIKKCSFDHMRSTKEKNENLGIDSRDSPIMYRKGKVGDWKNHFTVSEDEQFNFLFDREMDNTEAFELYSHKSRTAPQ